MTRIEVRLVGEEEAVRRTVVQLAAAADIVGQAFRQARTADSIRAYLTVDVPEGGPVFENVPRRRPTPQDEARTVAMLQARPGEWARIGTYPSNHTARQTASLIRRGRRACYAPAGAYEAEQHPASDGSGAWRVYARYVGGGSR